MRDWCRYQQSMTDEEILFCEATKRPFLSRANIQSGGGVDVVNNCKLAVLPGKFRKIYTLVFCFLIVASIFRHIGFQNQILYL